jgi:periplasmic protein TonB
VKCRVPDLDGRGTPRQLWILAAVAALALHVGGAGCVLTHLQIDEDESLGSPAIEIGLEMMSPRREAMDLPPGPDSDAAIASPSLAEQTAEVKESELPKDRPDQTDDPDRMVTPNESRKPIEEDNKVAAVQTAASQQSAASEASAMPTSEAAPEGPRSAAPALGTGDSARRVRATWQKELMAHFDKHKRYPGERAVKSAEIVVSFVLDRLGHVVSASVARSSGDAAFDQAALAMLRRADPVPQPPPLVADEGLNFTMPVIFRARAATR